MNYLKHEIIHEAVRSGDVQRVREILIRNPSCVNNLDKNFYSPLHLIYDHINPNYDSQQADDRLPIMQLLIEYGANVNVVNGSDMTPLSIAVKKYQVKGVKMLLDNKANPNIRSNDDRTALLAAVEVGYLDEKKDVKIFELLLEYKADPNLTDEFGNSALDLAVYYGRLDYAQILLDSGIKIKSIYRTFIKICCMEHRRGGPSKNYLEIVDFLWRYIAFFKDNLSEHDHFSISNIGYNCEETLNKYKNYSIPAFSKSPRLQDIDIDYKDSNLHTAVRGNNESLVKALLENKDTNVNEKNAYGETPLHLIFNNEVKSYKTIGELLIEAGTDWRAQDLFDRTPFYLAVLWRRVTVLNIMLRKIAALDDMTLTYSTAYLPYLVIKYTENDAALHEILVAIYVGCEPVIDRLLDEEYNIEEASKSCRQDIAFALIKAIELNECDIVKKLLEDGFRTNSVFSPSMRLQRVKIGISCLLWEFNDRNTVFKLFRDNLYYYSPDSDGNVSIDLVLFYYFIDEHINGSNPDLMLLQSSVYWKSILEEKFANCKDDFLKMKTKKVGCISAFDIMTMEFDLLVKLLNDPKFNGICRKIIQEIKNSSESKYYDVALLCRLELALEKNEAMNAALHCFDDISENHLTKTNLTSLPYKIGWDILSNLNMRDIKKLALSSL